MKKIVRVADMLQFTSNNAVNESICHVFRQKGYIVATDGHILLRFPVDAVAGGDDVMEQDTPSIGSVIPTHFDKPKQLRITAIEAALEKVPKVDAQEECPECGGGGTVMWTYEGNDDDYEQEFRCPRCHGKGYVPTEGELMPDPKQVFTMLDIKYHTKDMQRLIRAINMAGVKQAKILNHEYHRLYIEAGSAQILIAGVEEEVWGEVIKVI